MRFPSRKAKELLASLPIALLIFCASAFADDSVQVGRINLKCDRHNVSVPPWTAAIQSSKSACTENAKDIKTKYDEHEQRIKHAGEVSQKSSVGQVAAGKDMASFVTSMKTIYRDGIKTYEDLAEQSKKAAEDLKKKQPKNEEAIKNIQAELRNVEGAQRQKIVEIEKVKLAIRRETADTATAQTVHNLDSLHSQKASREKEKEPIDKVLNEKYHTRAVEEQSHVETASKSMESVLREAQRNFLAKRDDLNAKLAKVDAIKLDSGVSEQDPAQLAKDLEATPKTSPKKYEDSALTKGVANAKDWLYSPVDPTVAAKKDEMTDSLKASAEGGVEKKDDHAPEATSNKATKDALGLEGPLTGEGSTRKLMQAGSEQEGISTGASDAPIQDRIVKANEGLGEKNLAAQEADMEAKGGAKGVRSEAEDTIRKVQDADKKIEQTARGMPMESGAFSKAGVEKLDDSSPYYEKQKQLKEDIENRNKIVEDACASASVCRAVTNVAGVKREVGTSDLAVQGIGVRSAAERQNDEMYRLNDNAGIGLKQISKPSAESAIEADHVQSIAAARSAVEESQKSASNLTASSASAERMKDTDVSLTRVQSTLGKVENQQNEFITTNAVAAGAVLKNSNGDQATEDKINNALRAEDSHNRTMGGVVGMLPGAAGYEAYKASGDADNAAAQVPLAGNSLKASQAASEAEKDYQGKVNNAVVSAGMAVAPGGSMTAELAGKGAASFAEHTGFKAAESAAVSRAAESSAEHSLQYFEHAAPVERAATIERAAPARNIESEAASAAPEPRTRSVAAEPARVEAPAQKYSQAAEAEAPSPVREQAAEQRVAEQRVAEPTSTHAAETASIPAAEKPVYKAGNDHNMTDFSARARTRDEPVPTPRELTPNTKASAYPVEQAPRGESHFVEAPERFAPASRKVAEVQEAASQPISRAETRAASQSSGLESSGLFETSGFSTSSPVTNQPLRSRPPVQVRQAEAPVRTSEAELVTKNTTHTSERSVAQRPAELLASENPRPQLPAVREKAPTLAKIENDARAQNIQKAKQRIENAPVAAAPTPLPIAPTDNFVAKRSSRPPVQREIVQTEPLPQFAQAKEYAGPQGPADGTRAEGSRNSPRNTSDHFLRDRLSRELDPERKPVKVAGEGETKVGGLQESGGEHAETPKLASTVDGHPSKSAESLIDKLEEGQAEQISPASEERLTSTELRRQAGANRQALEGALKRLDTDEGVLRIAEVKPKEIVIAGKEGNAPVTIATKRDLSGLPGAELRAEVKKAVADEAKRLERVEAGSMEKKGFLEAQKERLAALKENLGQKFGGGKTKILDKAAPKRKLAEVNGYHPSQNVNELLRKAEDLHGIKTLTLEDGSNAGARWNPKKNTIEMKDRYRGSARSSQGRAYSVHELGHYSTDAKGMVTRQTGFTSDSGRVYGKSDLGSYSKRGRVDELEAREKELGSYRASEQESKQRMTRLSREDRDQFLEYLGDLKDTENYTLETAREMLTREREINQHTLAQLKNPDVSIKLYDTEVTRGLDRFEYRFLDKDGNEQVFRDLIPQNTGAAASHADELRALDIRSSIQNKFGKDSDALRALSNVGSGEEGAASLEIKEGFVKERNSRAYRVYSGVDDVYVQGYLDMSKPLSGNAGEQLKQARSQAVENLQKRQIKLNTAEAHLEKHYGKDTKVYDFGSEYHTGESQYPNKNAAVGSAENPQMIYPRAEESRPWGEEGAKPLSPYAERAQRDYKLNEAPARDPAAISDPTRKHEFLTKEHSTFREIGPEDNKKYIKLAEAANAGEAPTVLRSASMQAAVGKSLNDIVIKNKDKVNEVFNQFKSIFEGRVAKDKFLSEHLIGQYSDFNTIKMSFNSDSKAIDTKLKEIFADYNQRYSEFLDKVAKAEGWDKVAVGLAAKRENWHHLGIGKTPDEANLAARKSREMLDEKGISHPRTYEEVKHLVEKDIKEMEITRAQLAKKFGEEKGMFVGQEGKKVLSAEASEVIRKADQTDVGVKKALQHQFKETKFSEQDVTEFRSYVSKADSFSPDLYVGERVEIPLDARRNGIVSADFKGQNARNLEETMKAMLNTRDLPAEEQIRAIRKGEFEATKTLDEKKDEFRQAIRDVFGKEDPDFAKHVYFTGDDGIYLPAKQVSVEHKIVLADRLGEKPDNLRLTYNRSHFADTGKEIPREQLSEYVVRAEKVEKDLRKAMIEHYPREVLNNSQIVVDMKPYSDGKKSIGVYLGGKHTPEKLQELRNWTENFLKEKQVKVDFVKGLPGNGITASERTVKDAISTSERSAKKSGSSQVGISMETNLKTGDSKIARAPAGAELVEDLQMPSGLSESQDHWLKAGLSNDLEEYGKSVPSSEAKAEFKRLADLRSPSGMPASPGAAYYQQQVNYTRAQLELLSRVENEEAFGGLEKVMDQQFKLEVQLKKTQQALQNAKANVKP